MSQRSKYLLKTYGISSDEYDQILSVQNFACAICNRPSTDSHRLSVDHKHQKREKHRTPEEKRPMVRGLLCWKCNTGLQKFNDKPELFINASKYLTDPPAKKVIKE